MMQQPYQEKWYFDLFVILVAILIPLGMLMLSFVLLIFYPFIVFIRWCIEWLKRKK
jgi:hypothetical protein